MPQKRARELSGSAPPAGLQRFTEAELAAELVQRQTVDYKAACAEKKMPKWCLDASTQKVMTDPVQLPQCGHVIDRDEFDRVFAEASYGPAITWQKYRCPVPACGKLIWPRPFQVLSLTGLKKAIVSEQERRQNKFHKKHQKAYDAIKLVVDTAFEAATSDMQMTVAAHE